MKQKSRKNSAVSLKYRLKSDSAPRVTAKGKGKIAEKIIKIAKEHDIYIHEDPDLIEVLSQLYLVVAELLAFVYSLNQKMSSI